MRDYQLDLISVRANVVVIMEPNTRKKFWYLKLAFLSLLLTIFGIQCTLSFVSLIQGGSDLVQLTFIDAENNKEYKHPLYTVKQSLIKQVFFK